MPQPLASAAIDTGGSLYTNLVFAAMVGSDGTVLKDYLQNITATLTNCSVVTGGGSEKGVQFDASGDYATFSDATAYNLAGNVDWTIFVYGDLASGNDDGTGRSFISRADDPDFSSDRWFFNKNFVNQLVFDYNGSARTNASAIALTAATGVSYAVRRSGSTVKWYELGSALGSTEEFSAGVTANSSSLRLGATNRSVYGTWKMAAMWKGTALSDANIASLHADPWQLWVGGRTGTASITEAADTMSATGTVPYLPTPVWKENSRDQRRARLTRRRRRVYFGTAR